jgi:hypothetical protein
MLRRRGGALRVIRFSGGPAFAPVTNLRARGASPSAVLGDTRILPGDSGLNIFLSYASLDLHPLTNLTISSTGPTGPTLKDPKYAGACVVRHPPFYYRLLISPMMLILRPLKSPEMATSTCSLSTLVAAAVASYSGIVLA